MEEPLKVTEASENMKMEVVTFNKIKIQCCVDSTGNVFIALKPICDAIGIHTDKAYESIKKDPILGPKATVRWVLDAKKRKFPMQTLPMEYVHGWLFQIDASKVSAAAKPKLIEFKEHCYQVLFNHFFGRYRIYEANLAEKRLIEAEINQLAEERAELQAKITKLKKRMHEITALELSGQFTLNLKGGR